MDVLGADPDVRVRLGEGVADGGEAHERRADDPDHAVARGSAPRSSGRGRRRRPGSCASSNCAATITSRIAANHARAGRRRTRRRARPRPRSSPAARAARGRAGRPSGGSRGARRARRGSPPASRGGPRRPAGRRRAGPASRPSASSVVDRVELAAGGADRALEVGRFGVEDAVELAAQRPRDLARLELEQRAARADPAQERADGLAVLGRHDAPTTAQPPRHRQPELGQAGGQLGRLVGRDHELEVGPAAGEAKRATRQEAAAQPRAAAVVRGGVPVEGRRGAGPVAAGGGAGGRAAPTDASRRDRARPETGDLGDAGRTAAMGRWRPARRGGR